MLATWRCLCRCAIAPHRVNVSTRYLPTKRRAISSTRSTPPSGSSCPSRACCLLDTDGAFLVRVLSYWGIRRYDRRIRDTEGGSPTVLEHAFRGSQQARLGSGERAAPNRRCLDR